MHTTLVVREHTETSRGYPWGAHLYGCTAVLWSCDSSSGEVTWQVLLMLVAAFRTMNTGAAAAAAMSSHPYRERNWAGKPSLSCFIVLYSRESGAGIVSPANGNRQSTETVKEEAIHFNVYYIAIRRGGIKERTAAHEVHVAIPAFLR